jgi:transposase
MPIPHRLNAPFEESLAQAAWLAAPARFEVIFLPTYCPKAKAIECAFGDVPDQGAA